MVSAKLNPYEGLKPIAPLICGALSTDFNVSAKLNPYEGLKPEAIRAASSSLWKVSAKLNPYEGLKPSICWLA